MPETFVNQRALLLQLHHQLNSLTLLRMNNEIEEKEWEEKMDETLQEAPQEILMAATLLSAGFIDLFMKCCLVLPEKGV